MFRVRGAVLDRGAVPAVPVSLNVVVGVWDASFASFFAAGDVETGEDGRYSFRAGIAEVDLESLSQPVTVAVSLTPYYPEAPTATHELQVSAPAGTTIRDAVAGQTQDLDVAVDLGGLEGFRVEVRLVDDPLTERHFARVTSLFGEVRVGAQSLSLSMPVTFSTAGGTRLYRDGARYRGMFLLDPATLDAPFHLRCRSGGPNSTAEVNVRSQLLADRDTLRRDYAGSVLRIHERIGVGTISASFPARIADSLPIVLMDLDLDFVVQNGVGRLRVRGRAGIGLGANLVLFSIGRFEALVSLGLVDHESGPFDLGELRNLFTVTVDEVDFDVLPGTDLDELPAWVYVGLALLFPGAAVSLGRAALVVAAVEAAVERALPGLIRNEFLAQLEGEVVSAFNDTVDGLIETAEEETGLPIADDFRTALDGVLWFEGERVEIDLDDIHLLGWAGVWETRTSNLLSLASDCPIGSLERGGGGGDGSAEALSREEGERAFRPFSDTFEDPKLAGWMAEYRRHLPELHRMSRRKPLLLLEAAKLAVGLHPLLREPREARLQGDQAKRIADVLGRAAEITEDGELRKLIGEVAGVLRKGEGRTVSELGEIASKLRPAEGRSYEAEPGRMHFVTQGEARRIQKVLDDGKPEVGRLIREDRKGKKSSPRDR